MFADGRRHEPEILEKVYESEMSDLFTVIKGRWCIVKTA